MRLNKFIAGATGLSRRSADQAIGAGKVQVNGSRGKLAQQVTDSDTVSLDGKQLTMPNAHQTILLNKPVGYVCSRDGQGSKTVYDLLPEEFNKLKPVGRLDKDSSGLLLLTNDGELAHKLTHPKFQKHKVYEIVLNKPLASEDKLRVSVGVKLEDDYSALGLKELNDESSWQVTMSEGRNRQIRRTFEALGYSVTKLHRTQFGDYSLKNLKSGEFKNV